jgi:mannose-6-phosphate isomerase-like protein (cupin superfamily)
MDTEFVKHDDQLLAIIIYDNFKKPGIHFFTSGEASQQLAYMKHPKGKIIQPHVHNQVVREVFFTQEVLLIKEGKLKVNFYTDNQNYIDSRILNKGDVILLMTGGHGFEVLDDIEMIEVKQGPYVGENDKTRFVPNS